MRAFLYKYKHLDEDVETVYCQWKIAKDERTAFKYAFGKAKQKNQDTVCTKRGSHIQIIDVEDYDVSKIFPISPIPKREPTQEVSDHGDWML